MYSTPSTVAQCRTYPLVPYCVAVGLQSNFRNVCKVLCKTKDCWILFKNNCSSLFPSGNYSTKSYLCYTEFLNNCSGFCNLVNFLPAWTEEQCTRPSVFTKLYTSGLITSLTVTHRPLPLTLFYICARQYNFVAVQHHTHTHLQIQGTGDG